MNVKIVSGNLLDATEEQFLLHQCNCVSNGASGLAASLFQRFPHANVYATRKIADIPGTIDVRGNGKDQRFIVNAFAQYYPGGPDTQEHDGKRAREEYLRNCLLRVAQLHPQSIALPFGLGAGLARGDWNIIMGIIQEFALRLPDTKVVLYKLESK